MYPKTTNKFSFVKPYIHAELLSHHSPLSLAHPAEGNLRVNNRGLPGLRGVVCAFDSYGEILKHSHLKQCFDNLSRATTIYKQTILIFATIIFFLLK